MNQLLVLILVWLGGTTLSAVEKGTANFYQSAPHEYLGKEIRLRVASLTPVPELTAVDAGFVWMEASTGRPQKEEGKILLRIPSADSAKLAKTMNLPSSSGRWLEGTFQGHDTGAVLPSVIKQKAPYYVQVTTASAPKDALEAMETASGSLVVAPKPKEATKQEAVGTAAAQPKKSIANAPNQDGPKAVLLRAKPNEPLQLRVAKTVKTEADFCEITDPSGKLSLVGKPLVAAILPLPRDGTRPTQAEVEAALRLYAEKAQAMPEAGPLLAEAKASWEKFSVTPLAITASAALPELEDVETAAGVEEPEPTSAYPAWFVWSTMTLSLIVTFLAWVWSRPRSYLT